LAQITKSGEWDYVMIPLIAAAAVARCIICADGSPQRFQSQSRKCRITSAQFAQQPLPLNIGWDAVRIHLGEMRYDPLLLPR